MIKLTEKELIELEALYEERMRELDVQWDYNLYR